MRQQKAHGVIETMEAPARNSHHKHGCTACDWSATSQFVMRHYVAKHADRFRSEILNDANRTPIITTTIKVYDVNGENPKDTRVICCLGCMKHWSREVMATRHLATCPNKAVHAQVAERCMAQPAPAPVAQPEPDALTQKNALILQLQEEIQQLKDRVVFLENMNRIETVAM